MKKENKIIFTICLNSEVAREIESKRGLIARSVYVEDCLRKSWGWQ